MEPLLVVVSAMAGLAIGALIAYRGRRRPAAPAPPDQRELVELVLTMTGDKMRDHSAAVDHQSGLRNALVEQQIEGMGVELSRVSELVVALQHDRARQHGELMARLAETSRQGQHLAETTQSLRQALASPKARGQWGERMADDVLRLSGLVEGINYRRQTGIAGGGIPDVTFLLPGERVLHMDVKFPIDNYLRALEAASGADARVATAAFARDVRQRVREVTTRAYLDPDTTVDYVLLFIPNESVYSFIHEHDPDMIDTALSQRVVLCSPFTLFAVLAVIRQAMDAFQVERSGDEILRCMGGFVAQWARFSDQVDVVAKRLDRASRAYDDLAGTRRKALQRTIDEIDALRVSRDIDGGGPTLEGGADREPMADAPAPLGSLRPCPASTSPPRSTT